MDWRPGKRRAATGWAPGEAPQRCFQPGRGQQKATAGKQSGQRCPRAQQLLPSLLLYHPFPPVQASPLRLRPLPDGRGPRGHLPEGARLPWVHAPSGAGGGGAPAHRPGHARCCAARGRAGARGAVIRGAGRRPQLRRAVPAPPPSPAPRPHHGAGVGGRGPTEPLPGGLCGEPEQVPAEAGDLGR